MIEVYKTVNDINNKIYIGCHECTKRCIPKCKYLGGGVLLKKAIKNYGKSHFRRIIIKEFNNFDEAFKYEKEMIEKYKDNSYNVHIQGSSQTKDTRRKISISNKGKMRTEKQRESIKNATIDAMKKVDRKKISPWTGAHWYTNGKDNHQYFNDEEIPAGWKRGRTLSENHKNNMIFWDRKRNENK